MKVAHANSSKPFENGAIPFYFLLPKEKRLETAVRQVSGKNNERLPLILSKLRDLQRIDSSSVISLLKELGVTAQGPHPFRKITRALREERAALNKEFELLKHRSDSSSEGIPFSSILKKNQLTPNFSTYTTEQVLQITDPLDVSTLILDQEKRAKIVFTLCWLNEYLETMEGFAYRTTENKKPTFNEVFEKIVPLLDKLGNNIKFNIFRFGKLDGSEVSFKDLNALNQAIAEEITIPNGIDFQFNFNRSGYRKPHYVGIIMDSECKTEITPVGRIINRLTSKPLTDGFASSPRIRSQYILETPYVSERLKRNNELLSSALEIYFAVGSDDLISRIIYPSDRLQDERVIRHSVESDLLSALEEYRLRRRFNDASQQDQNRLHKIGLREHSPLSTLLKKTNNPSTKFRIGEEIHNSTVSLLAILYSENPLKPFLESTIPAIRKELLIEYPEIKREAPIGLEDEVLRYIEEKAKETKVDFQVTDTEKLLLELSDLKMIRRRYVSSTLQKYGVNSNKKDEGLAPIISLLRNAYAHRPKPKEIPNFFLDKSSSDLFLKVIGKHIEHSVGQKLELRRQDGSVNYSAWDNFLQNSLHRESPEESETAIRGFNKLIREAAFSALKDNYVLCRDLELRVQDWNVSKEPIKIAAIA